MRLLRPKSLEALPHVLLGGSGGPEASVTLLPEEPEDMWHAYNLIAAGDALKAAAVRLFCLLSRQFLPRRT